MKRRADGRYVKVKTIDGKRVSFYSSEPTEKKALRDIEAQMLAYTDKIDYGKTFHEVADEWESEHYKHLQHQTVHRYKSLTAHAVEYFDDMSIKQIKPVDIDNFLCRFNPQTFSTTSLKDQLSVVKLIFKYAVIKEYTDKNPTLYIIPPKGKAKVTRDSLTDDEIKAVENNLDKEFGLLAFFLLYSGLRKGEALALTYGDIDRENNTITVSKSVEHIENLPHIKEPKTRAGVRTVPLIDKLKQILPEGRQSELLFSQNGQLMTASYFDKHWQKYKKETGLNITAHRLRHTYTKLLFEWGIDMKDSQEILGHSDIATTRNIYTHIRKKRIADTTDKINKILNPTENTDQQAD